MALRVKLNFIWIFFFLCVCVCADWLVSLAGFKPACWRDRLPRLPRRTTPRGQQMWSLTSHFLSAFVQLRICFFCPCVLACRKIERRGRPKVWENAGVDKLKVKGERQVKADNAGGWFLCPMDPENSFWRTVSSGAVSVRWEADDTHSPSRHTCASWHRAEKVWSLSLCREHLAALWHARGRRTSHRSLSATVIVKDFARLKQ